MLRWGCSIAVLNFSYAFLWIGKRVRILNDFDNIQNTKPILHIRIKHTLCINAYCRKE